MVAALQTKDTDSPSSRLVSILREMDLPGEDSDHQWIAKRLQFHAEHLSQRHQPDYLADLFVSSVLRERGIDPSKSHYLANRTFPAAYVQSAPKLLQIAFPLSTWRLVESGVLCFDGTVWGQTDRWIVHGECLKSVADSWHELGEYLMLRNLSHGLIPLINGSTSSVQLKLTGVDRETGRKWLRELTTLLSSSEKTKHPHLVLSL